MEYQIADYESATELQGLVNSLIKEGWIPLGGITTTSQEYKRMNLQVITFYQAMTRSAAQKKAKTVKKKNIFSALKVVELFNKMFAGTQAYQKRAPLPALLQRIDTLTNKEFHSIQDWENFFNKIKFSDFLMSRVPPSHGYKQFRLKLEWIIAPKNLAKFIEGQFHG